ncbi:biotin biosynthesis protein BioY [Bifidobacterium ramosum]|uniref:Biotin transporter n=1 Tax=Bifidobacterium ramosum TaxID=1798158 RepID=A0A6L4X147_9BIFI|nr:biotin transporter BioY [Bifidobacterium ramosum]KAB8288266.1 biotin biosynthesis protein BioY [Bifidobacterium ramosum]NEG71693.1 biotin transporter BioY [Bifidobacterium ramosum]
MANLTETTQSVPSAIASRRAFAGAIVKPVVFAVLLALATMAGRIPIPGTPVPITLQTFVVMVAALTMSWRQAGAAIALYLAAGAAGLPVFSGGASTAALLGPSAGFLIGFLPAAVVTALLKGSARRTAASADLLRGAAHASGLSSDGSVADDCTADSRAVRTILTALRYFAAAVIGCIVLDYLFGFTVQSAITGMPFGAVALASMGFVAGDLVKAAVASLAIAGAATLRR